MLPVSNDSASRIHSDLEIIVMTQIKPLLSAFERFAYGQSLHSAFTDMLDWMLLPFKKYNNAEDQQQALETYRNHSKVQQLVPLITMIGELSEGFADPLGELFMQAISNGHNGQFFTPEPICSMIATMQLNTVQPWQTVYDCACGSGRMLLAAAKINRHLLLYGGDIDATCCKMALLNMLFNSLQGEIAHMDSLSNEFHRGYKVSTVLHNGYYYPCYDEFTEAEQSRIWLKPLKGNTAKSTFDKPFEAVRSNQPVVGIQGSLF